MTAEEYTESVEYFETVEEAIAAASEGSPGAVIVVHDDECDCELDGEGCTCEAVQLVVGERGEA